MEAQEFKGQFKYLGEITKKWITFSAPIEKEIKVYEKTSGDIIDEKITYKLKLADSAKFIDSLSNLADNLSQGIHKTNVNIDKIIKTAKNGKLNAKITSAKDDLLIFKCLCPNRN